MNTTLNHPDRMTVETEHVQHDGRVMVHVTEKDSTERTLWLWITPEVAAQWIEALQPLAAEVKP